MFNQYIHDIVYMNSKAQLGFNELVSNEISRIQEADIGAINCLVILKKNINIIIQVIKKNYYYWWEWSIIMKKMKKSIKIFYYYNPIIIAF